MSRVAGGIDLAVLVGIMTGIVLLPQSFRIVRGIREDDFVFASDIASTGRRFRVRVRSTVAGDISSLSLADTGLWPSFS